MKKITNRLLTMILSLSMLVSVLTPAVRAEAATQLVNIASKAVASTENGAYDSHGIANINDGDTTTSWQTEGVWPATAILALDMGRNVTKVTVELGEDGDSTSGNTVNVTVQYAQNGVTSDLISLGSKRVTVDSRNDFMLDVPFSATHIYVTLSEPQTSDGSEGSFWPSIQEVEVYEAQDVKFSNYENIASQANISATGNNENTSEGSANLVDGKDSTLYKFYNGAMESEQTVTLTFDEARSMDAFRIAFENVGSTDSVDFEFIYSILAKKTDGTYDTIVDHASANRTDNSSQSCQIAECIYSEIQIVMHSCTTYGGTSKGWPAIAEFEVYGSEIVTEDTCISYGKPVHASSGKNTAKNVTDGNKNSKWTGDYYPAYVDIDLEENYNLESVEVYTPENGYTQYSIYTSMDGRDFEKLAEKTSTDSATLESGEIYQITECDEAGKREARIVRVYVEYCSVNTTAILNEVRVNGTASGTEVQERPEINVVDFEDSAYADTTVTADDTYQEVYGIIKRRLGEKYQSWFSLELAENPKSTGYDFFELSMTTDGKVLVKGNDGVSLAMGINHYLKYYCNVNISQVGDQVTMPAEIPAVEGTLHKETKAEVRYSYNYCTLSYSMSFWGEEEWRNELDWLALNGVNVVLDATAQEEVWRRFLGKLGYEHEDIKDFVAGPGYYAWAYMANLSGFGGPVHDSWFEERTELARKNQQSMRNLGMQPILQGYSGMVPTDIQDYDADAQIIEQGTWCSFQRPAMLVTTSETFDEYAELFYECQKEVYGDSSHYYATDPFHEGGNTGGMDSTEISKEVLTSMLEADENCVWVIQAWQGNPTTALLNGLDEVENGASHALVLDLYAEKTPHYGETGSAYGDTDEFDDTPWLFCMLNNFGGRLGLHGHLDNLAEDIPYALNNCEHIKGIGITPEASVNNPVLYDFIFETVWQNDVTEETPVIDLNEWLPKYAERRYGAKSDSANAAWEILKETVYKSELNEKGQGAPESVVNARPALDISAASTWGNAVISYDKADLEKAAQLLLVDYDKLKDSEGYQYDLATLLQQVLSNTAQEYQKKMASAYTAGNLEAFEKYAKTFLAIIDDMETVTSSSEYYLFGTWVKQAEALAEGTDDFTKELYTRNAKALVTTWGSYNQAESGGLKDYSNRQWSGLIGDFYKTRWERWITARTNELKGEEYEQNINWFEWEWSWVRSDKEYTNIPAEVDLQTVGTKILKDYKNPAEDDSRDIPVGSMTVTAGDSQGDEGPERVLDNDASTLWHTQWGVGETHDNHWIQMNLEEVTAIGGLRYQPRQEGGTNGIITKYEVWTSLDGETWTTVATGSWDGDSSWKMAEFEEVEAKYVRLVTIEAMTNQSILFASAAEIRLMVPKVNEVKRTFGIDRNATSLSVAEELKSALEIEKFDTIIVATGKLPYDALAGSYLANAKKAPILLTNGKESVNTAMIQYIQENANADAKIYILGGTSAVSEETETRLASVVGKDNITRLQGANRLETNLAILNEVGLDGQTELLVATSLTCADSLSASATGKPILLVNGKGLTEKQKEVVGRFANGKIYILGGTSAVSEATVAELESAAENAAISRLEGSNRYETSVKIAQEFFKDSKKAVIAYGKDANAADGLCGGALAAALNAPLILTKEGEQTAADYANANDIKSGYVLGGDALVNDELAKAIFDTETIITKEQ